MKPIIEFCASNMHHGTGSLMKKLEQNPDFDVIEYGCLGNCGECYLAPFGLVDGEIIAASTVEELESLIMEAIERQQAEREALDRLIDDM
ncbi:YuzB family protein [Paenibacillus baekrokdamisoli]|uniref:YuzB family protein n=1 Tax=Paenibacillus baekrokdamisoli TaxID=1712516 RepID=UPI000F78179D|nr:YuzB family protein [Paenibacillus baekrokdamisoli]